ncbi:MAG: AI-2E family transporter [Methanimicrococcus sp.]|nr:AI-2E family transporter [Methanimicrococcus sp.]
MFLVAVILFLIIAFIFYIKPIFIALVFGILATVLFNKIVDVFYRATAKYSSLQKKAIAASCTLAIVLVAGIGLSIGAVSLLNNVGAIIDFAEDFTNQYNDSAESLAIDLAGIAADESLTYIFTSDNRTNAENASLSETAADPPPAAASGILPPGYFGRGSEQTTIDLVQSVLISGRGIIDMTAGTISILTTILVSSCLIIPIMVGYNFKERGKIRGKLVTMVPDQYKDILDQTIRNISNDMGTFTIAKILEAVVIIFLYCLGFYTLGIPYWLLAGIIMGIFNAVPYVGFMIPAAPVIVYAYTIGMDVMIAVVAIIIAIQIFDIFFLLPNMVMKTIKISSLTAVILTLAGLKLFGIFGLIFAVPIYIFCKIILVSAYKMLVTMYPDPVDPNEITLDEG